MPQLSFPAACLLVYFQSAVVIGALSAVSSAQSLRQEAENAGVLIGTAVRPSQFSEGAYASTLAREFNIVEAEDAMKWWDLRPDRDTYDFRQGDEVVRFAQAHQMMIRGHCLVWGRHNPDWLTQNHFTSKQLARLMQEHISKVMKHYKNQVFGARGHALPFDRDYQPKAAYRAMLEELSAGR